MKINIIGTSGSGKSTFGRRIAEALAIPYIEMDRLYWRANWQGTPDDEFLATLEKALAASPDWVLDGNYNRTRDVKWRDVDLVVWIDRGFIRTLWQAVTRASRRAWHKQELWPGTGTAKAFVGRSLPRTLLSSGRSKPGAATANAIKRICKTRSTNTFAFSALPDGRMPKDSLPRLNHADDRLSIAVFRQSKCKLIVSQR